MEFSWNIPGTFTSIHIHTYGVFFMGNPSEKCIKFAGFPAMIPTTGYLAATARTSRRSHRRRFTQFFNPFFW
jgi:hypothetical protein